MTPQKPATALQEAIEVGIAALLNGSPCTMTKDDLRCLITAAQEAEGPNALITWREASEMAMQEIADLSARIVDLEKDVEVIAYDRRSRVEELTAKISDLEQRQACHTAALQEISVFKWSDERVNVLKHIAREALQDGEGN